MKIGGPRGEDARAMTGTEATSRASGSWTGTTSGAGAGKAGAPPTDDALSRRGVATLPAPRSNRSQQSRDLILEPHPRRSTLWTALTDGQQHLSINRPMPWQKYWTPPAARSGSAKSNAAKRGKSRARRATISFISYAGRPQESSSPPASCGRAPRQGSPAAPPARGSGRRHGNTPAHSWQPGSRPVPYFVAVCASTSFRLKVGLRSGSHAGGGPKPAA